MKKKIHGNFKVYGPDTYTCLEEKVFNFKINPRTCQKLNEEEIVYYTATIFGTAMF